MRVIYHPEVEQIIRTLPKEHESRIFRIVDLFEEYKFSLTKVYLKKIVKGIWELRAGRYRLLFGMVNREAIVVSVFMKKTQKTPKQVINVAIKRLKKYEKQK